MSRNERVHSLNPAASEEEAAYLAAMIGQAEGFSQQEFEALIPMLMSGKVTDQQSLYSWMNRRKTLAERTKLSQGKPGQGQTRLTGQSISAGGGGEQATGTLLTRGTGIF